MCVCVFDANVYPRTCTGFTKTGRELEVVKLIRHKAASPTHTDRSIVFARWRQCAPHPSLGPQSTQVSLLSLRNGISIGTVVFALLTTDVPGTYDHADHGTCDVCNNRPSPSDECDVAHKAGGHFSLSGALLSVTGRLADTAVLRTSTLRRPAGRGVRRKRNSLVNPRYADATDASLCRV